MKNILFICTANICRSPFAEKAFAMLLKERNMEGVMVHSAGVMAVPGLPPPKEAIRVATEFRVDVSRHASRPLSIDMIKDADVIPVMNIYHLETITEREPESEDKLVLLGNYCTTHGNTAEEMEIPDPYGFSSFHYRYSFNIIRDCINNIFNELFNS